MLDFYGSIILIIVVVILCNKDKWAADNRIPPPGMMTDWTKVTSDTMLYGKDYCNKKIISGGYDIPDIFSKSSEEESNISDDEK